MIAGGRTQNIGPVASAELYDPATGTFALTGTMAKPRGGHSATLLPNGKVLIADFYLAEVPELYDPLHGKFTRTDQWQFQPSQLTLLTLRTNGKVLDTSLNNGDGDPTDLVALYDPVTGAFSANRMTALRQSQSTATLLPCQTVLIAGGGDSSLPLTWSRNRISGAELYDPATDTFSVTGSMASNREFHTATLLPDGWVLAAGGVTQGGESPATATAEIYHPGVLVPAPVLFSLSQDGRGQGAILHAATHQFVLPSNPAVAGEALEIYGTGLMDGSVIPPQIAIGGRLADILFFGKAPGYAGLNQVNVRVPSGVVARPAVAVRLMYLGRPSNEVTIGVR